jgi:hypothetical protein
MVVLSSIRWELSGNDMAGNCTWDTISGVRRAGGQEGIGDGKGGDGSRQRLIRRYVEGDMTHTRGTRDGMA